MCTRPSPPWSFPLPLFAREQRRQSVQERNRANALRDRIDALQFDLSSIESDLQRAQGELIERDQDAVTVRDTQAKWRSARTVARLLWAWRGILPSNE